MSTLCPIKFDCSGCAAHHPDLCPYDKPTDVFGEHFSHLEKDSKEGKYSFSSGLRPRDVINIDAITNIELINIDMVFY